MDYTTAASCSDYDSSSSLYFDESGLDAPNAHQRPASSNSAPGAVATATTTTTAAATPVVQLRRPQSLLPPGARSSSSQSHQSTSGGGATSSATSSYRFSMANLEETHEAELDAILGELSMLEQQKTGATATLSLSTMAAGAAAGSHQQQQQQQTMQGLLHHQSHAQQLQHQQQQMHQHHHRGHSRTNSMLSHVTNSTISSVSTSSESGNGSGSESGGSGINGGSSGSAALREPHRTESPDNDSAFSDTVSLMSSESSASSGGLSHHHHMLQLQQQQQQLQQHLPPGILAAPCDSAKAAKIHLALQKLEQASVRRLFVKAFTTDGASKSLLVDERMTCAHVTRLLADKNHVQMEPHWALVEQLPDLQMERLFEDHELLVDNLMNWRSDSKNRVLFVQRPDKVSLFNVPERYLPGTQMAPGSDHDENTRAMLLDEFFAAGHPIVMEGALFLKPDAKKAWKRHHFVLRASGLYYFPKEKTKSAKDLICLALFADHDVYRGCGWKKKHKAPGDHTFALKQPRDNGTGTGGKEKPVVPKLLCAEDAETLDRWLTAIRVAKYGRRLLDAQRQLVDDLQREELERFSAHRCGSIGSIVSAVPSQCSSTGSAGTAAALAAAGGIVGGRLSRASSSSSSGCLSDETSSAAGFDSEFPTGTIKRKPSMKPNLPLTSMTRQLKEVGETTMQAVGAAASDADGDADGAAGGSAPTSPERGGTLTRRHSRRRSEEASSNSGTLKRRTTTTASATSSATMVASSSLLRGSVDSMGSSSTTSTPTGSAPGTPVQGSSAAAAAAAAQHLLLSNTINNNTTTQQQNHLNQHYHHSGGHHLHHLHNQHHLLQQQQQQQQQQQHINHHQNHHHQQQQQQLPPQSQHLHLSPLEIMPASMTDSTFSLPPPPPPSAGGATGIDQLDNCSMSGSTLSLESLPPPPPPCDLQHLQAEFSASQTSLVSLPPPPPEIRPMCYLSGAAGAIHARAAVDTIHPVTHFIVPAADSAQHHQPSTPPQPIYAKSIKQPASIIKAPPYKAPPPYNNNASANASTTASTTSAGDALCVGSTSTIGKSVTFADSPVLLRRKQVCFEDQVYTSPRRPSASNAVASPAPPPPPSAVTVEPLYVSSAPPPPPRAEATRLSAMASPSLSHTSPKRLSDSQANPPQHFLKDLQRVMRKKWQVAQKCKLEPATTPHEVLGFRDFELQQLANAAGAAGGSGAHFYRETSNVSNWVQEHYGAGDAVDDGLYENLGADGLGGVGGGGGGGGAEMPPMMMVNASSKLLNKRPPPPPPKRSLSTQLSTQQLRS